MTTTTDTPIARYEGALASGLSDAEAREDGWPTTGTADRIRIAEFNKLERDYKATLTTDDGVLVSFQGRLVMDYENVAAFLAWAEADGE